MSVSVSAMIIFTANLKYCTYPQKVGDLSEHIESRKFPTRHVDLDLLGLFDGHILPRFSVLRLAEFLLDGVDTCESKLALDILELGSDNGCLNSRPDTVF